MDAHPPDHPVTTLTTCKTTPPTQAMICKYRRTEGHTRKLWEQEDGMISRVLPCKHEDRHSDAQLPCKKLHMDPHAVCIPSAESRVKRFIWINCMGVLQNQ